MKIAGLDHVVLTVRDAEASARFYADVLGMAVDEFEGGRLALRFGNQKINLHEAGRKILPRAARPTPGAADICLVAATPLGQVIAHLRRLGVAVEEGPVARTGALGPMTSVYLRDPDGNLIEVCEYANTEPGKAPNPPPRPPPRRGRRRLAGDG